MKTLLRPSSRRASRGHALTIVLVFLVVGLMVLAGTMQWLSTNALLIERNNGYFAAAAAAEAATEKVLTAMSFDYQQQGAARVLSRMETYRQLIPTAEEHPGWNDYRFTDNNGVAAQTAVLQVTPWAVSPLISQYRGLSGFASTFRVQSTVTSANQRQQVAAAVQQDIQIATIPLFQFAIFYNIPLEMHPGPNMTVNGRVHSNHHLYTYPGNTLTLNGDVTAAGEIFHAEHPDDPSSRGSIGTIVYNGEHDSGVNSLNMPLGVENTPENVRQIIEPPPTGESPTSALATQRYYNKSDVRILVYDDHITAEYGALVSSGPAITAATLNSFVKTNLTFYNKREGKTVKATQIDVAALKAWSASAGDVRAALGGDVSSVYVADFRTQTVDTQPGIRLVNGAELPSRGLTVATPQPLYVKGHYNAPVSARGTANTDLTRPAALIADAITVLSDNWEDSTSTSSLKSRVASHTTVNSAFLAGIVPTTTASYSGGVENFPRFLEDWSGRTLTYNGSMVVMFPSQVATGTWKGTGSTIGIYNPPVRNWSFDLAFLDPTRLPPGTPEVRAVIRGQWSLATPGRPSQDVGL